MKKAFRTLSAVLLAFTLAACTAPTVLAETLWLILTSSASSQAKALRLTHNNPEVN